MNSEFSLARMILKSAGIYSDEQIDVWDFSDYPQFMVEYADSFLVPLTQENAGDTVPFEDTLIFGKSRANGNSIF